MELMELLRSTARPTRASHRDKPPRPTHAPSFTLQVLSTIPTGIISKLTYGCTLVTAARVAPTQHTPCQLGPLRAA